MVHNNYLQDITLASRRIKEMADVSVNGEYCVPTPIHGMKQLSYRYGNTIMLKREDLHSIFSFKWRGAFNKIASLGDGVATKNVVAASAGNHAQGVALAAQHKGIHALIVMPETTPPIKVDAVKALGAEVVLHGDSYDEAAIYAQELCKKESYTWVSPYDDIEVIAGQATVAVEIDEQHKDAIDVIFIPCGGGGLLAGMALWLREKRPNIKIVGVESEDAACMSLALKKGERVTLSEVGLFADGAAVACAGKEPFNILSSLGDIDMVQVSNDELCSAIKDIFIDTRSIAEPAGALALAGLKKYLASHSLKNKKLFAVFSGANINFNRLSYIAENTELSENQEVLFSVTIPEKAGSFLGFCKLLGRHSITEFNYRYSDDAVAKIFVGIVTSGIERKKLLAMMKKSGYEANDLTQDLTARRHVRHMIGGKVNVPDEVLYRVQFPERPGALLNFLQTLGANWNISLFHYRSHGAAYGRVLIGLQVSAKDSALFKEKMDAIGFAYHNETANQAYTSFLRPAIIG